MTALIVRIVRWIVFGVILCGIAIAGARIEIQVTRDRITAGDLANHIPAWADVEPAAELDYAPLPGIERRVTRGQIVQWGSSAGLELDPAALPDSRLDPRRAILIDLKYPRRKRPPHHRLHELQRVAVQVVVGTLPFVGQGDEPHAIANFQSGRVGHLMSSAASPARSARLH